MREKIEVYVERCRDDVILPTYANKYDAGMDIRSCVDITIKPNETVIVPTGLKFAIPEGYEIQVRPRSGLSYKTPLRISNAPGTIDAGYRDEVGIIVTNISQTETIEIKERQIAQSFFKEFLKLFSGKLMMFQKSASTGAEALAQQVKNRRNFNGIQMCHRTGFS